VVVLTPDAQRAFSLTGRQQEPGAPESSVARRQEKLDLRERLAQRIKRPRACPAPGTSPPYSGIRPPRRHWAHLRRHDPRRTYARLHRSGHMRRESTAAPIGGPRIPSECTNSVRGGHDRRPPREQRPMSRFFVQSAVSACATRPGTAEGSVSPDRLASTSSTVVRTLLQSGFPLVDRQVLSAARPGSDPLSLTGGTSSRRHDPVTVFFLLPLPGYADSPHAHQGLYILLPSATHPGPAGPMKAWPFLQRRPEIPQRPLVLPFLGRRSEQSVFQPQVKSPSGWSGPPQSATVINPAKGLRELCGRRRSPRLGRPAARPWTLSRASRELERGP